MRILNTAGRGTVLTETRLRRHRNRARDLLENIKVWLETNPFLKEDFPEVCFPIQCLERITNRQKGQHNSSFLITICIQHVHCRLNFIVR